MSARANLMFAVHCDLAIIEAGSGKSTLAGIFDRVFVTATPTLYPGRLFFVFQVSALPGKHAARVLVKDDAERDILPPFGPVPMEVGETGLGNYNICIGSLPIPRLGQYHFLVEIDGAVIGERALTVSKRP